MSLKEVLTYWFGDPSSIREEKDKWRGALWFRGLDPNILEQYPNEKAPEIHKRTDAFIAERFGPLFHQEQELESNSQEDVVAQVVLYDQLARNAFRGTPKAFAWDAAAQVLAKAILEDPSYETYWESNWNHALFMCIALMHAENAEIVKAGFRHLQLVEERLELKHPENANRLKPIIKQFLSHLDVIFRFGRYPSRNAALGRTSTTQELEYLWSERLPGWAKSQLPANISNKSGVTNQNAIGSYIDARKKKPLRILVLHGNRANLRKFKSRVRDTLKGISSLEHPVTLDYIKAPNLYHSQDTEENRYVKRVIDGSHHQSVADNRCWWYMNDEGQYVGLEKSIQTVQDWIDEMGPYDGILGFAQGGCMAAVLVALQHEGKLRISSTLKFAIIISGFYCRDRDYSALHASLKDAGDIHSTENVQPRKDKIRIPSFHTWGQKDTLIDGWRSEMLSRAFQEPVVEVHPGEHMARAIEHWPITSIRKWLASLNLDAQGAPVAPIDLMPPLQTFSEKFFALRKSIGSTPRAGGVARARHPFRLHHQQMIENDPIWSMLPESISDITYGMLAGLVPRLLQDISTTDESEKEMHILVDDAMIVAWCFYPFDCGSKRRKCRDWNFLGQPFCWMVRLLYEQGNEDTRKYLLDFHLPWIARYADTWESLIRIDMIFQLGSSEKSNPPSHSLPPSEYAGTIRSVVAKLFAEQIAEDYRKTATAKGAYNAYLELGNYTAEGSGSFAKMQLYQASSLPSNCTNAAPRRGNATQKRTRLFEDVADALTKCCKEALVSFPRGSAENRYRYVLKQIVSFRKEYAAALVDSGSSKENFQMSDLQWKEALAATLSPAVTQPAPEPVDIATAEQMAPLHDFLRKRPGPLEQKELIFERGTLLDDGRLDLCKQVIGPQGIKPLFESLLHDENGLVQHLLLGNNIAGDELGMEVGAYILSGESKLTTWYIAGNRLTADGIRPVCQALSADSLVRQLWLKRNPLLPAGMVHIASLLRNNSHLQVLDLTNTDILDEGCEMVMEAMVENSSIEYLYVDTNGISLKGAKAIRRYFETTPHRILKGLGLGCNRLGDEGVKELLQGLNAYGWLKRLTLASCGIGIKGSKYLADFLGSQEGSQLRSLDLGFLKSTFAVGEVPNRIHTEGATILAQALRSNCTLESLIVANNSISNSGFVAFEKALRENHVNSALRHFVLHQPGIPANEIVLEKIRFYVREKAIAYQKRRESGIVEEDFVDPPHLDVIQSVYRVGAQYNNK